MADKKGGSAGGIGFVGLLTIAFIVLKLCKIIKWSWLWVLSPIWICAAIVIAVMLIIVVLAIIKH
jgi:hypothetical protein